MGKVIHKSRDFWDICHVVLPENDAYKILWESEILTEHHPQIPNPVLIKKKKKNLSSIKFVDLANHSETKRK